MFTIEKTFILISFLLILSIFSSKASGVLGVPALLLFLGIGILAGSEGIGGIYFDNYYFAQEIGILAFVYILFSGGLSTDLSKVRDVKWPGLVLSTLGVLITAACVAYFAKFVLGFSSKEGFVLGGMVASTDAASVFSILRSRQFGLKGKLRPLLELESGSNDPMAVFLTIGFISVLKNPDMSVWQLLPMFAQQMALGAIFGLALGKALIHITNKLNLEYEGLYPVFMLSIVLMIYGICTILGGNGFLAMYILGVVLGNSDFIHKTSIIRFHDGVAWLMQITLFLTLGLLIFPSNLLPVAEVGLLLSAFLMFLARPLSVFISMAPFKEFSVKERVLVSWVGLRGAAAIILATFPLVARMPKAEYMFNLIFFVVLISMLVQGPSIPFVAKLLKLDAPLKKGHNLLFEEQGAFRAVGKKLIEVEVEDGSFAENKQLVELGFPKGSLIVLITRNKMHVVPQGDTKLEKGDSLMLLSTPDALEGLKQKFAKV